MTTTYTRQAAIQEIASAIVGAADRASDLIDWLIGTNYSLDTWTNEQLAEQLEYLTGECDIEIVA